MCKTNANANDRQLLIKGANNKRMLQDNTSTHLMHGQVASLSTSSICVNPTK